MSQKIVLLVGPSGGGKSSTYPLIEEQFPDVCFRHLDGLASDYAHVNGWIQIAEVGVLSDFCKNREQFLAIGLMTIVDFALRNADKHLFIDVGAGFQAASYATRLPGMHPTIALVPRREVAYARWRSRPGNDGSTEGYFRDEFNERRESLYARCIATIDNSDCTPREAAARLAMTVRAIIG